MDIDHLDGGEFLQGGPWGQTRSEGAQTGLQSDLETISQEGDEKVRIDAPIQLVVNRTNTQVALELFERMFDFGQLDVPGPEMDGIAAGEIGAQQIEAFAAADLAYAIDFGSPTRILEPSRRSKASEFA